MREKRVLFICWRTGWTGIPMACTCMCLPIPTQPRTCACTHSTRSMKVCSIECVLCLDAHGYRRNRHFPLTCARAWITCPYPVTPADPHCTISIVCRCISMYFIQCTSFNVFCSMYFNVFQSENKTFHSENKVSHSENKALIQKTKEQSVPGAQVRAEEERRPPAAAAAP